MPFGVFLEIRDLRLLLRSAEMDPDKEGGNKHCHAQNRFEEILHVFKPHTAFSFWLNGAKKSTPKSPGRIRIYTRRHNYLRIHQASTWLLCERTFNAMYSRIPPLPRRERIEVRGIGEASPSQKCSRCFAASVI